MSGASLSKNRTLKLQELMRKVGITSFKQLYQLTGTSAQTIGRIRSGELATLRWQTLIKISTGLNISPIELLELFGDSLRDGKAERPIDSNRQN
jgi:DNA-binding Xre family transcriptional regulator